MTTRTEQSSETESSMTPLSTTIEKKKEKLDNNYRIRFQVHAKNSPSVDIWHRLGPIFYNAMEDPADQKACIDEARRDYRTMLMMRSNYDEMDDSFRFQPYQMTVLCKLLHLGKPHTGLLDLSKLQSNLWVAFTDTKKCTSVTVSRESTADFADSWLNDPAFGHDVGRHKLLNYANFTSVDSADSKYGGACGFDVDIVAPMLLEQKLSKWFQ